MKRGGESTGSSRRPNPVRGRRFRSPAGARCRGIALVALFGWLANPAIAEPLVVGYERFHADEPTAEGGALLFSELGCANCHGESPVLTKRQGPNLSGLAQRVDREWIVRFLRNPETGREGSSMPHLFHGLADADIQAVVDYLGTVGPPAKPRAPRYVNAERGSALYHEKGCVACHAPTPDFKPPHGGEAANSKWAVAHPDFREKTSLAALDLFLATSSKFRPDGRMPHFDLEPYERGDLAAHLIDFQGSDPEEADSVAPWPKPDAAAVARGQALAERLNCAACHALPEAKPAPTVPLSGGGGGDGRHCFSVEPRDGLPHYELNEGQRQSLTAFLKSDGGFDEGNAGLTLAAMNCYACHERDGVGGPPPETDPYFTGDEALGDSGRLPPPLTDIGHKLRRDWMEDVFRGEEGSRVRPYVATQMPNYPNHAAALADWFESIDAVDDAKPMEISDADPEAGRKLVGAVGGVNCITCHRWKERPSLGIQAMDIASLDKRLRPEWFRSYLLNPAEYRPGTLMPPLWPGGQSTVKDVLGGDTEKQIASVWAFIERGEGIPDGFPERGGSRFELVPEDRPIILRTFFEGAGTKAILVGFPGDIHLAYDGEAGRPALVWRGRFFNAYHTWFSRHAPMEKPLGDEVHEFAVSPPRAQFGGYLLDDGGNPVFLTRRDGREVEEKFAVAEGKLVRTLEWEEGEAPAVAHPRGVEVETKTEEGILTCIYSWE
ncbi:MAG: c-type cytochrome [Verrucomicrobiales bacterium]